MWYRIRKHTPTPLQAERCRLALAAFSLVCALCRQTRDIKVVVTWAHIGRLPFKGYDYFGAVLWKRCCCLITGARFAIGTNSVKRRLVIRPRQPVAGGVSSISKSLRMDWLTTLLASLLCLSGKYTCSKIEKEQL